MYMNIIEIESKPCVTFNAVFGIMQNMAVKNKKISFLIILLLVICIAAAVFLFALRHYISKFSDPAFISSFLSEKTGCPVTIEKITLTTTNTLLVEGLRVNTPKNIKNPGELIFIKKIFIYFDPWELIKKRDIQSVSKIEIIEPYITLTDDYIDWLKTRPEKELKLPEKLPLVSVSSGSATLKTNGVSMPLNNIEGNINPLKDKIIFDFNGVAGSFKAPWKISGSLPKSGERKLKLSVNDINIASICKLLNITIPANGKITFSAEGKGVNKIIWTGTAKSDKTVIWNMGASGIKSSFSYNKGVISISDLSGLVLGGTFTGKGTVIPDGKNFNLNLKANFNNLSFEASGKIFPEISGISGNARGNIDIKKLGKNLAVSLQGASDNLIVSGKKLPPVTASVTLDDDALVFNPLVFSNNDISLKLNGKLFYKQRRIKLTGSFKGDSIEKLSAMIKDYFPGLKGNLAGDFSIEGDIDRPEIKYNGKIMNFIYDNKPIGDGLINIAADKNGALKGRLDLDKPLEYINKIPKGSVKLHLYFDISGTIKKPVFTPVTTDTKINIDPIEIWNILKKSINI